MKKTLQTIKKAGIYSAFFCASLMSAQTTYTFTNASAIGRVGPTAPQITAAYLATNLNGSVTVTGGIQSFTVPTSGLYQFNVAGAKSGDYLASIAPGFGRIISGTYNLTAGTVLNIVVGQNGLAMKNNNAGYIASYASYKTTNAGGGGGTFVYAGTTLLYAAGGGGAPNGYRNSPGSPGNFSTAGSAGVGGGGAGGTLGAPGAAGGAGATAGSNGVGGYGGSGDGPGGGGGGVAILPSTCISIVRNWLHIPTSFKNLDVSNITNSLSGNSNGAVTTPTMSLVGENVLIVTVLSLTVHFTFSPIPFR